MKCEKAIDMISAYIDGVLNKEEQEEFMKHIESCESCAVCCGLQEQLRKPQRNWQRILRFNIDIGRKN